MNLPEAKHGHDFIIGVDLGQARDYTAIAILERIEELTGEAAKGRWLTQVRFEMPHLERPPSDRPQGRCPFGFRCSRRR